MAPGINYISATRKRHTARVQQPHIHPNPNPATDAAPRFRFSFARSEKTGYIAYLEGLPALHSRSSPYPRPGPGRGSGRPRARKDLIAAPDFEGLGLNDIARLRHQRALERKRTPHIEHRSGPERKRECHSKPAWQPQRIPYRPSAPALGHSTQSAAGSRYTRSLRFEGSHAAETVASGRQRVRETSEWEARREQLPDKDHTIASDTVELSL